MSKNTLSEAKWILVIELVLLGILLAFTLIGAGVAFVLLLFTLYFFRDPVPATSSDPGAIVAPATGKVDVIETAHEPLFRGVESKRISIFLSVFDIHTQRAPIACTVKLIKYNPGKFANAISPT